MLEGETVPEELRRVIRDPDVVSAWICALFASSTIGFAANIEDPAPRHAVFALLGVAAA